MRVKIVKFYSLQNFLLEVFGKENEKIELDHTNTGEYYFYIYIKDTNINKEYKIEKIESIFFEKKVLIFLFLIFRNKFRYLLWMK